MVELHERYPNQWVLYREDWDDERGQSRFEIVGIYDRDRSMEATARSWEFDDEERSQLTLMFTEVLPQGTVHCYIEDERDPPSTHDDGSFPSMKPTAG